MLIHRSRDVFPPRLSARRLAAAAVTILTGSIYAQTVPNPATTRTWDGPVTAVGTFNWGDPVNWSADTLPGPDEIANFNLAPAAIITIDLGGVDREIGSLFFSANGASNYLLQNGTIVTNSINQNNADPNALTSTALVRSKNGGADVINASVSSDTLQLQGMVTAGGLNKFGGSTLRLGTSGTAFNNAINGPITIYGGTLTAAANATSGSNNPLGGSGDIVIGNNGVTLSLTANGSLATGAEYDFVRDIRGGNRSFNIDARLAGGTDTTDPNMRAGTLFTGAATVTMNQGNGFRVALDGINIATGSAATRFQFNALTFTDGLIGDAASNVFKRGGSDFEIRGNNEGTFAGDIFNGESNLRFLSTGAGVNPAGGSDSTIFFSNGYGLAALDGGQTVQLRSDASLDYGSHIAFRPGVTIGRIDVNRVGGSATNQTLSLGNVNVSGRLLRILGGNGYALGLNNVVVDPGATGDFEAATASAVINGNLVLGAGSTFNKLGGVTLTLNTDNSASALGTINLKAGTITGTVAGSLASAPLTVGNATPNTAGYLADFSRLNLNTANVRGAASPAIVVVAGGVADLNNSAPGANERFDIRADGRIQGDPAQLGALTVGANLTLSPNAIVMHETPGDVTGTVNALPNDASVFYGLAGTANSVPTIGAGTPWKGLSSDNTAARLLEGLVGAPAVVSINGGDNNPGTIEATFQSMNNQNLDFGAANGSYSFATTAPGGAKVTLGIRGALGSSSLGLVPGGRVVFRNNATITGLNTVVDKVIVQSGTFSVQTVNGLGGVPVEVQNGGSLDIGNVAGDILDGNVTIQNGGVLVLNDAQLLGGTGTMTIEGGGKLEIVGAPADIFTASTQPINFAGSGHTVRFSANEIGNLDASVPNAGVTYVVAGGAAAAILPGTNVSVTTNTQSAGLTIEGGILTNDATSRGFSGPITLNNTSLTVAATRGTTLAVTSNIATNGNVQIGSATAIDFRDKTPNPSRVDGLGRANPYDGSPQVVFTGPFNVGGALNATGTHLAFADANTNIAGDLNFQGNVLYLDGGGPLNGGTSVRGDLTPRLTDTSGLAANRVANRIILGNLGRLELSVTSAASGTTNHTITQPFVIEGAVNPNDKRTFWVDRGTGAATTNVFFNDILLKPNAQIGFDESNTVVRTNLRLEGNATLVRNHDDYDLRNLSREPSAPANITVLAGEPNFGWDDATEYLINGSNATLSTSIDGTIASGITVDLIRSTFIFEQSAVLNGTVRAQTAPARGDAFIISRSSGLLTPTTFGGSGEIQLSRSVAANGPEDFDLRGTEVVTGNPAPLHTVTVPVRILNDASATNIDGIIRADRHNDSNVTALTQLDTLNVEDGATVQFTSVNGANLTLPAITLGANSGIDSTNNARVFIGNIAGGANAIRFSGPAQARITGNIQASQLNVTGAGLDFDPGTGLTSAVSGPIALSGVLSVRTGTVNLGTNLITGAPVQTVPGLRENKTGGSFDQTSPNSSNEIKLGPVLAQASANAFGDNQTVTYTGQINIPDNGTVGDGMGSVSFAKFYDDNASILIDGVAYLRSTAFNDGVGTGPITLTTGFHDIEIRLGNGTGGAGPVGQDGNAFNLGLGIDLTDPVHPGQAAGVGLVLDGSHYVLPLDDGAGSLFRTTTLKSGLTLAADTSLSAGGFANLGNVTYTGAFGGSVVDLDNTGAAVASTADLIRVGTDVTGTLEISRAVDMVTAASLDVGAGGTFTKTGAGKLLISGTQTIATASVVNINGGVAQFDGAGSGDGLLLVSSGGLLQGNGGLDGPVTINDGVFAPGNGAGDFETGDFTLTAAGRLRMEIGGTARGTQYDQIITTGGVTLGGVLEGSLINGFTPAVNDIFFLILNDGVDPVSGTFAGLGEGASVQISGFQFSVSYAANGDAGATPNDVALIAIPEPASIAAILSGLGMLCGLQRFRRHATH